MMTRSKHRFYVFSLIAAWSLSFSIFVISQQSELRSSPLLEKTAIQSKREANVTSAQKSQTSKYAYAFVVGGCRPEKPEHRGFIYNILVCAKLFKEMGSQADIVAMIQMSSKTNATRLGDEDENPLKALGVRIKYLSKEKNEGFYSTVKRKFDIVGLTEYRRVMLLDGDVMPLGNLDYLFELSDGPNPILKPNFVLSGPWEPSNAGFFMLEPGEGRLEEIREIIKRRENQNGFDRFVGWGHPIQPPDKWVARSESGTNWTFLFSESDQGLLYYYTKYYRKNVSMIQYKDRVENWGTHINGSLVKEGIIMDAFKGYAKPILRDWRACNKFKCDMKHFTGSDKPWFKMPLKTDNISRLASPVHLWWDSLRRVNEDVGMGLNFSNWNLKKANPLGLYATKWETIYAFEKKVVVPNNNSVESAKK